MGSSVGSGSEAAFTEVGAGQNKQARKCNPTEAEIDRICRHLPFGAPRPAVDVSVFGLFTAPIPCSRETCWASKMLRRFDGPFLLFLLLWAITYCVLGKLFDMRIQHLQHALYG